MANNNYINEMLNKASNGNANNGSQPQQFSSDPNNSMYDNCKEYANQRGMTYKDAFFNACREKLLNPADIMNQIMGRR